MGSPSSSVPEPSPPNEKTVNPSTENDPAEAVVEPVKVSESKEVPSDVVNAFPSDSPPSAPNASPPVGAPVSDEPEQNLPEQKDTVPVTKRPRSSSPAPATSKAATSPSRAQPLPPSDASDPFSKRSTARRGNRRKRQRATRPPADDASEGEGETQDELALLREAQRLRAQSRRGSLPQRRESARKPDVSADGPAAGGLQATFLAERGARAGEARMEKYVSERLASRFGDEESDARAGEDVAPKFADELYAVPEHLRAAPAPAYDPGAGLPAAGVEEVDVPGAAERNERETAVARARKGVRRAGRVGVADVPANMAADYRRHRQEWIEAQKEAGVEGEGEKDKEEKQAKRGRRVETASDAAAVERFRKRWRP